MTPLRRPPWEPGAGSTMALSLPHVPPAPTISTLPDRLTSFADATAPVVFGSAARLSANLDSNAGADTPPIDPDAPLITWRWQERAQRRARAERSATLAVDRWAPSSLDCRPHDHVRAGLSYLRSFAVLETPRRLHAGALARLYRLPGVQTVLVNNPVPRALAKARLADLAHRMGVAIHQEADADAHESLSYRDLKRHLTALVEERSAHHLFGLYLTIAAADRAELEERTRALLETCADVQLIITRCDGQHLDGMLTIAPLGRDNLRYLLENDTPTLARFLPSSPALSRSGSGVPILVRAEQASHGTGAPIMVDRFALTVPHEAVIAASGSGKTYQMTWRLLQRFAHGRCGICVIDPKNQEYRALIERTLGGQYLVVAEHADVRINPLMLPYGDDAVSAQIRTLNLDVPAQRAALLKRLVVGEAQARGMPLSGRAETQLEEAILACYAQRGITHDPATFHAEVPTLSDVVDTLAQRAAEPDLLAHMDLFTQGRLGRLINAPGTLPLQLPASRLRPDVGVLGIDLSAFLGGNDATLQRVLPVLIADYCLSIAMHNAGRSPLELIIDEAWTLLATEAGSSILEVVGRVGRSLKVAATVITQQIREFLYRPVGDTLIPNLAGRTFLDNCALVLLLGQQHKLRAGTTPEEHPVLMAAHHFGLAPGEVQWLAQCRRDAEGATGLLLREREPIQLRIPQVPQPLHNVILGQTPLSALEHTHE